MTTYQQCDGQCHKTSGDHPVAFLIWWRTKKTSFNGLRNRCRYLRNLLRTSQNRNVCESVMANTEKKYWCLTYVFVLNDYWISLTNQIPQVSCWIAQRHNDQKHQNKDNLQVTQKKAARQEMKSTASVLRTKPGRNKKLPERTHHQLKHHQRWERYEKERCQRSCMGKYEPVNHDDRICCCQFKYLALLLMSIVTHSIIQPAGPNQVL